MILLRLVAFLLLLVNITVLKSNKQKSLFFYTVPPKISDHQFLFLIG